MAGGPACEIALAYGCGSAPDFDRLSPFTGNSLVVSPSDEDFANLTPTT